MNSKGLPSSELEAPEGADAFWEVLVDSRYREAIAREFKGEIQYLWLSLVGT